MSDDEECGDPFDHYEEYSEWMMNKPELHICNGDALVRHLESATQFDDFLEWKNG